MTDYDILASSLVLVGCLAKRKRTINRRAQARLAMVQFRHFGTVFVEEDRETGKVAQKPCLFKAKFHYTDPTRTGYGQSPRTLSGPCRVRVVEFSYYATKSQTLQLDFVAR